MSIRKIVRQVQELQPHRAYAIVVSHRLTAPELHELKDMCEHVNVRVLIITDARLVPLDQVSAVLGHLAPEEQAKLEPPETGPIGPGSRVEVSV